MTIEQAVLEQLRRLSAEDQRKVLEYAKSLVPPDAPQPPRKSVMGMFAHLGVHVTLEDIREMRREAWANFPRDFPEGTPS
jgi:hypothetical protein